MLQPYVNSQSKSQTQVFSFNGLDRTLSATADRTSEETNMSKDFYPALSPRKPRGLYLDVGSASCVSSAGYGAYITTNDNDETELFVSDAEGNLASTRMYSVNSHNCNNIVKIGKYFVFFPANIAYDTLTGDEINLNGSANCSAKLTLLDSDMEAITNLTISSTTPASPADGDVWVDTVNASENAIKKYSSIYTGWFETYCTVKITINSGVIKNMFLKTDDKVQISAKNSNGNVVIGDDLYEILDSGETYIIIKYNPKIYKSGTNSCSASISRKVPDMDYVIECNNRLWGYSNEQNELYSCELGNPLSWNYFGTDATASYALKVGTKGNFTAIVPYGSYILFFKENYVHKLYGLYPAVYQMTYDEVSGVKEGCAKTAVSINGLLFYQGTDGIYAYSGSYPTLASQRLGSINYGTDSSSGAKDNKYYITLSDDITKTKTIYVYDTVSSTWSREDEIPYNSEVVQFGGALCFRMRNRLLKICGDSSCQSVEKNIHWSFATAQIRPDVFNHSVLSKLIFKIIPVTDCALTFSVEYDQSGTFEPITTYELKESSIVRLPIVPRRCREFRIKIDGKGDCRMCGYNAIFRQSGDR